MARKVATLSLKLDAILKQLGENIRLARLRRNITTEMLAERAGMTRATLRKVEKGDSGTTMGAYASVLFCLNLEHDLLKVGLDDILGRKLQDLGLSSPKKRASRLK